MATIIAGPLGVDMAELPSFLDGTVYLATGTEIDVVLSNGIEDKYFGSFSYSGGFLVGGIFSAFQSFTSYGGTLIYSVTGLSVTYDHYFSYAEKDDAAGLETFV